MIDLTYHPQSRYDCSVCPTRCDGRSKEAYIFEDDVALSERSEHYLLERLQARLGLTVRKTTAQAHGLPDLEVLQAEEVIARVEVKVQQRAFMAVERLLPQAGLRPYETVALNLSDLRRYIALQRRERKPLLVVWHVLRPCIGDSYWGHSVRALDRLLRRYGGRRRFRRASTQSDYVAGEHRGVTVNYHFSLRELYPLPELEDRLSAWCERHR